MSNRIDLVGLSFGARGRRPAEDAVAYIRDLTDHDLVVLDPGMTTAPEFDGLKRLRDRHHMLARCLAQGMSESEAAAVTGYTNARISVLKENPAFEDLVAMYKAHVDVAFANVQERMASLALDAVDELHTRLEETPEEFDVGDLIDVTKLTADRTGNGPVTRQVNLNVNVGMADRLRHARERVALSRQAREAGRSQEGREAAPVPSDIIDGELSDGEESGSVPQRLLEGTD
jgi:hypothetical protein